MWFNGPAYGNYELRVFADTAGSLPAVTSPARLVFVPHAIAYLADLHPSSGLTFSTGSVSFGGQTYLRSVSVQRAIVFGEYGRRWDTAYNLSGQWRTFRAVLSEMAHPAGPMGVQVSTDGRTRLRALLQPGQVLPFRFDVRTVKTLVLTVAAGSYPADSTDPVAFGNAVLQNDTTTDIPSGANTVFVSDLTPTATQPAGTSDNQLAYPGAAPGNLRFGAFAVLGVDATTTPAQVSYTLPPGYTTLTARIGGFDECTAADTLTVIVLGDGKVLATYGPTLLTDLSVPVNGVHELTMSIRTTVPLSPFHCVEAITDSRLAR